MYEKVWPDKSYAIFKLITRETFNTHGAHVSSCDLCFPGIQAGFTCFPSITVVKADRPFYFQIVDEKMGVVLFAGKVRKPDPVVEGDLFLRCPFDYGVDEYSTDYDSTTSLATTENCLERPEGNCMKLSDLTVIFLYPCSYPTIV